MCLNTLAEPLAAPLLGYSTLPLFARTPVQHFVSKAKRAREREVVLAGIHCSTVLLSKIESRREGEERGERGGGGGGRRELRSTVFSPFLHSFLLCYSSRIKKKSGWKLESKKKVWIQSPFSPPISENKDLSPVVTERGYYNTKETASDVSLPLKRERQLYRTN